MTYKIGDKFNVIISGFSPTVITIDNIKEKDGKTLYYISFQEERLFTLCRVVSAEYLDEIIDTYDKNKNNLQPFMMMKDDSEPGGNGNTNIGENFGNETVKVNKDIRMESKIDFTLDSNNAHVK